MQTKVTLNNKSIRNERKGHAYQALVIDLALLGALAKSDAELLLGGSIPAGIRLPDGTTHIEEDVGTEVEED